MSTIKKSDNFENEKSNISELSYEIILRMKNKSLNYEDEVRKVIYSTDNAKRYVILHSNKGFFKYIYEELKLYDDEEFRWICACNKSEVDLVPAYWSAELENNSFFGTFQEALNDIKSQTEYRWYF